MSNILPPPTDTQLPDRRAYLRFLGRLIDVHNTGDDGLCLSCRVPAPCDTMRAAWIFDLETYRTGA